MRNLKETNHAEEAMTVGSLKVLHDISGAGFEVIKSQVQEVTESVSANNRRQEDYWSRLSDDGIISASEKKILKKEWAQIYQTYQSILQVATVKGFINVAEIVSYKAAYSNLNNLLNNELKIFADMGSDTKVDDRDVFNNSYSVYYSAEALAQFGISSGLIGNLGFKALESLDDPGKEGDIGLYKGEFYQYSDGKWLKVGLEGYQGIKEELPNGIENQYFLAGDDFLGLVAVSVNGQKLKVNNSVLMINRLFEKGFIYVYQNDKWLKIENTYDFRYTVAMVDYYEVTGKLPSMFQDALDALAERVDKNASDIEGINNTLPSMQSQIEQHYGEMTVINGKVVIIDRNLGKYGSNGTGDIEADLDKKLDEVFYHIPINYGAANNIGEIPSNPGEGDYFVWAGPTGDTYVNSVVYRYDAESQTWKSLSATDTAAGGYYMTNLYTILQINNAQSGYFSALFAAAIYANTAWLNELHAQIVHIEEYGSIVTEDYVAGATFKSDGSITPTGSGQGFMIADADPSGIPARMDINGPVHLGNAWMEGVVHATEFKVKTESGNRVLNSSDLSDGNDLLKEEDLNDYVTQEDISNGVIGVCTSNRNIARLVATVPNFIPKANAVCYIYFYNDSYTTIDRTLNINNIGALPMLINGVRSGYFRAGLARVTMSSNMASWNVFMLKMESAALSDNLQLSDGTILAPSALATHDDLNDYVEIKDLKYGTFAIIKSVSDTAISASLDNFTLVPNIVILINFTIKSVSKKNRTLNVNETGAFPLYISGSRTADISEGLYRLMYTVINGAGRWDLYGLQVQTAEHSGSADVAGSADTADGLQTQAGVISGDDVVTTGDLSDYVTQDMIPPGSYAVCSNAKTDRTLTAVFENFQLIANSSIFCEFINGNEVTNTRSLNVNQTGSKPLYIEGDRNKAFSAGLYKISFDGTSWYLTEITVAAADSATNAVDATNVHGGRVYEVTTGAPGRVPGAADQGDTSLAYSTDDFNNEDPEHSTGFGLRKNGDVFFNNGYFRGHVEAQSGSFNDCRIKNCNGNINFVLKGGDVYPIKNYGTVTARSANKYLEQAFPFEGSVSISFFHDGYHWSSDPSIQGQTLIYRIRDGVSTLLIFLGDTESINIEDECTVQQHALYKETAVGMGDQMSFESLRPWVIEIPIVTDDGLRIEVRRYGSNSYDTLRECKYMIDEPSSIIRALMSIFTKPES